MHIAFPGLKFQNFLETEHLSLKPTVKNYLYSTMSEDQRNGLSHLHVNTDVELDYRSVTELVDL